MAVLGVAVLAGADAPTAARLGLSMLTLQVSIGALNDHADVAFDAEHKPGKPIPAGLVDRRAAAVLAAAAGAVGLGLGIPSGPPTVAIAVIGLALGYVYDVRLSRTALSWMPLALALPLVPVYGWLGATGTLPGGLVELIPIGIVGGAALALANGLVDIDRDRSASRPTIAVRLGRGLAWPVHALLLVLAVLAVITLAPGIPVAGGPRSEDGLLAGLRTLQVLGVGAGSALAAAGCVTLRATSAGLRERAWELEAIGVAALGMGWVAAVAGAARA